MASQSKPNAKSDNALRNRVGALDGALKTLMENVNKVSDEVKALQPLLETTSANAADKPAPKSSRSAASSKAVPEKSAASSKAEKAGAKAGAKSSPKASPKASPKSSAKASSKDPVAVVLEALNTLPIPELIDKLRNAKAKQNVIKNIVSERKKLNFQEFASVDDLVARIKGLAKPSFDQIVKDWS